MFKIQAEDFLFKPDSVLSQTLINIFSDLYDFSYNNSSDLITNFKETMDHFDKVSVPKIKAIVEKYTGIQIVRVVNKELHKKITEPSFFSFFSINVLPGELNESFKFFYSVTEGKDVTALNVKPETFSQISKLINSMSDVKDSFTVDFTKPLYIPVKAVLYFDLASAMFIHKFVHSRLEPLTSEEMTTLVLHEIGHVVGPIVFYKFKKTQFDSFKGAFDHFVKYADVKEKLSFFKSKEYKKLLTVNKNIPLSEELKTSIDNIDKLTDLLPNIKDTSAQSSKINFILERILIILCNVFLISSGSIFIVKFWLTILESVRNNPDKNISPNNDFFNRRSPEGHVDDKIADAFVVAHNMSSHLSKVVIKLQNQALFLAGNSNNKKLASSSDFIFNLSMAANLLTYSVNFSELTKVSDYTVRDRLKFILNKQMDYIQQTIKDPILNKLAIEEYEKCRATYISYSTKIDPSKLRQSINSFFSNFINLCTLTFGATTSVAGGTLLLMLISNSIIDRNLYKQIDMILTQAEGLINSDINASVAKMKLLTNKK